MLSVQPPPFLSRFWPASIRISEICWNSHLERMYSKCGSPIIVNKFKVPGDCRSTFSYIALIASIRAHAIIPRKVQFSMLQKFVKAFGGDPNKREIEKTTISWTRSMTWSLNSRLSVMKPA